MSALLRFALFLLLVLQLCSCGKREANPNKNLQLEAFSALRTPAYAIHPAKVRQHIDELVRADADSMQADYRARAYYGHKGGFLWIDRKGVDARADTLLTYLQAVGKMGFSPDKFHAVSLAADLRRMRQLDFDEGQHTIDRVLARIEYHLTKAYLRYVSGQRYGFTNPYQLFNRLDVRRQDSLGVAYNRLFDIAMQRPNSHFWMQALQKVAHDSVAAYLKAVQPQGELYWALAQRLPKATDRVGRMRVLCNMERARWRLDDEPGKHRKYALINLPSMHLVAHDGDQTLTMRIGIGALATKTPLLTSHIERMDVNPQWVMPRSIIEKSVAQHAGDAAYFESHRYYIRDRKSGERMDVAQVSADMLRSGEYAVVQEGGKGNAMGRIVFRFRNKFAVYLHDTSSRGIFEQRNRGVSHGCVRLEKPFDFAVFLLDDKDEATIGKIRYSMAADIHPTYRNHAEASQQLPPDTLDRARLVRSVKVSPAVPLFITYYTLYPNEQQAMTEYRDVYGFDDVIYRHLRNYMP